MVRAALRCALFTTFLAGCFLPTEPAMPDGALPFEPPAQFARWWELVEQCSGRTAAFANVRWYVVPGARDFTVDGKAYQGYTWNQGNRIVLADASRLDGTLVRHEMLHALSGGGHPAALFRERCGGIVACAAECATAVGDPYSPPASAPTIEPSELQLSITTYPEVISARADDSWGTVVVRVTNPHPYPVRVHLAELAPGYGVSRTFGFELYGAHDYEHGEAVYAYELTDRVAFRAGETRRYSFDFRAELGVRVCGWYNTRQTEVVAVRVGE